MHEMPEGPRRKAFIEAAWEGGKIADHYRELAISGREIVRATSKALRELLARKRIHAEPTTNGGPIPDPLTIETDESDPQTDFEELFRNISRLRRHKDSKDYVQELIQDYQLDHAAIPDSHEQPWQIVRGLRNKWIARFYRDSLAVKFEDSADARKKRS